MKKMFFFGGGGWGLLPPAPLSEGEGLAGAGCRFAAKKSAILRIIQKKAYLCRVIVTFDQAYLKELYDQGKTSDKKHRFQPDIVKRYQQRIKTLEAAPRIETLYQIKSLNYEVLSGDKVGISSIRVNDKYRIEFTVSLLDNPVVTICNILELSNHYK